MKRLTKMICNIRRFNKEGKLELPHFVDRDVEEED